MAKYRTTQQVIDKECLILNTWRKLKKVFYVNVSFDFCYFCVKKWLYIISVSLDFENNAAEDEILRRLCIVHELHLFRLPRERWELTKNENSYFSNFFLENFVILINYENI